MLIQDPVRIPDTPGRISYKRKGKTEYVQFLTACKYDQTKKRSEADRILIGRRCEEMPGLMFPNDNYYLYFDEEGQKMNEPMTAEESRYILNNKTYELYMPFFDGVYHEFKQQTRKNAEMPVNPYKAESINKVLMPLKEMMQEESYAALLELIRVPDEKAEGMTYGDVMILLTQYKSALSKFRRIHV